MPHPKAEWTHPSDCASLDHVVPKNPDNPERACRHVRGNGLVAHHGCNNRKGNRLPYPCELLHLKLINEILDSIKEEAKRGKTRREILSAGINRVERQCTTTIQMDILARMEA